MNIRCLLFLLFFAHEISARSVYFVVVAGGVGERLWPLSRRSLPKQFLSLDGKKSLLDMALDRTEGVVENAHTAVATTQDFVSLVKERVGDRIEQVFIEPSLRNTGPAICLAAMRVVQKDPDAVIVFLAADHFIRPIDKFKDALRTAIDYAEKHQEIVLLGIKPMWAATGYGYIRLGEPYVAQKIMNVVSFHEKPSLEKAQEYVRSGTMVWNGSYFCAQAKVFLNEFKRHSNDIFNGVKKYLDGTGSYDDLPNIAVDCAVMEKSRNLKAVLLDAQWSDVGDLAIFLSFRNQFENAQKLISLNAERNLVFSKSDKQIILLGVNDLCLVETDDAIVVARQDSVSDVKNALGILKTRGESLL